MADSDQFEVNEVVAYKDKICLIRSVRHVKIGTNMIKAFEIEDVLEDGKYHVYKHDMHKITDIMEVEDFAEDAAEVADTGATAQMPMESSADAIELTTTPTPPTQGRFAELSSADVDTLISGRTSENTNEQTRWALKIFRGKTTSVNNQSGN